MIINNWLNQDIRNFIQNNKEIENIFINQLDKNTIILSYYWIKSKYRNEWIWTKLLSNFEDLLKKYKIKIIKINAYKKSINFWKKNWYIIDDKKQIYNWKIQDYYDWYKEIKEDYIFIKDNNIIKSTKVSDNLSIPIIFYKKNYIYFLLDIEKINHKNNTKLNIKYKQNLFMVNWYKKLYFKNIYNFNQNQIREIAISLFSTIRFEYFENQDDKTIDDKEEFKYIIKEFLWLKKDEIFKIISSYKFINIPEWNKEDFDNFVYNNKKICNIFSVYKNKEWICDWLSHLLNICFIINWYNSKINYNWSWIWHFWIEDETHKYDPSYWTKSKLR